MQRVRGRRWLALGLVSLLGGAPRVAATTPPERWIQAHGRARRAWKRGDLLVAARALLTGYRVAREALHRRAARRSLAGLVRVYRRLERPDLARRARAAYQALAPAPEVPRKDAAPEEQQEPPAAPRSVAAATSVAAPPPPAPPAPSLTMDQVMARLALADGPGKAEALQALAAHREAGDPVAARLLGILSIEGKLLPPARERGLACLEEAASAGDVPATIYLAELLEEGRALARDRKRARELYRQAAEAGSALAAHRLGRRLPRPEEAERWLRVAAEAGRADAQVDLGERLYVRRDYEEAADWFHQAAQAGHPEGRFHLGLCLMKGHGLLVDRELGLATIRAAAEQGSQAAREALEELAEPGAPRGLPGRDGVPGAPSEGPAAEAAAD